MNTKAPRPPRRPRPQPQPTPMTYYPDYDRRCYPYHYDYDYDYDWDHDYYYNPYWWYDRNYISAEAPPVPPPSTPGGGGYPPPPIFPKPKPNMKTPHMRESNIDGMDNGWYNYSVDDIQAAYMQGFKDGWKVGIEYCMNSNNNNNWDEGYTGSKAMMNGYSCSSAPTM